MAEDWPEREAMEFDVVIVGAGPAGLAAAIRLKQLEPNISVVVLEKGSEVGAHILSGAVVDPIGLDRLIPDWRGDADRPLKTQVTDDHFLYLTRTGGFRLPNWPMPRVLSNHGAFVGSLGSVVHWLGARAEAAPPSFTVEIRRQQKRAAMGVNPAWVQTKLAHSTFGGEPRRVASPAPEIRKVDAPAAEPAAPRPSGRILPNLPRSNFRTIGPLRLRRAKRQRSPS